MKGARVVSTISQVLGIVFKEGTRLWQNFMSLSDWETEPMWQGLCPAGDLLILLPSDVTEYQEAFSSLRV